MLILWLCVMMMLRYRSASSRGDCAILSENRRQHKDNSEITVIFNPWKKKKGKDSKKKHQLMA